MNIQIERNWERKIMKIHTLKRWAGDVVQSVSNEQRAEGNQMTWAGSTSFEKEARSSDIRGTRSEQQEQAGSKEEWFVRSERRISNDRHYHTQRGKKKGKKNLRFPTAWNTHDHKRHSRGISLHHLDVVPGKFSSLAGHKKLTQESLTLESSWPAGHKKTINNFLTVIA